MAQECRQVELAAAWADAPWDAMELESTPLIPRAKLYGGEGTPAIDEFCVDELATLLEMSSLSAQVLIADAWICGGACRGCGCKSSLARYGPGRRERWRR